MSQHRVDVVPVQLEPHGNADTLSVVRVAGYQVVVRTADWQGVDKAAYVEPDYVVPADRPEFAFLAGTTYEIDNCGMRGYRIKVKRLRGVMSMGLLVPAPPDAKLGDNVIERLGVTRYDPPLLLSTGGDNAPAPPGVHYKYDVESARRYKDLLVAGEEVVVTEKVHGANGRFCFDAERGMHCGSRTEWKREDALNLWWRALAATPELRAFCEAHPGLTVYGEVYGQVQDLKYGCGKNEVRFAAFDLLRCGEWVPHDEARALAPDLPWVPVLYRGPWDEAKLFALADGDSLVSAVKQLREGIVVKLVVERTCPEIGRVQLKVVSNAYLERA